MTYDWPGNVRELQRVIERAVTLSATGRIVPEDLPPRVTGEYAERLLPSLVRDDTMRAWGSRYARLVLDRCDNNNEEGLSGTRDQLPHAAGLPAVPAPGDRWPATKAQGTARLRGGVDRYPAIRGMLRAEFLLDEHPYR